ncbi:hypothetical protein GCM10027075_37820 [Streptomyces heilongjiangensis]
MPHLKDQRHHGRYDQHQHDHHLEQEHLPGDTAPAQRRPQPRQGPSALSSAVGCGSVKWAPGAVVPALRALTMGAGRPSTESTQETDHVPCLHCPGPGGERGSHSVTGDAVGRTDGTAPHAAPNASDMPIPMSFL